LVAAAVLKLVLSVELVERAAKLVELVERAAKLVELVA
jgi:hypothetical protein